MKIDLICRDYLSHVDDVIRNVEGIVKLEEEREVWKQYVYSMSQLLDSLPSNARQDSTSLLASFHEFEIKFSSESPSFPIVDAQLMWGLTHTVRSQSEGEAVLSTEDILSLIPTILKHTKQLFPLLMQEYRLSAADWTDAFSFMTFLTSVDLLMGLMLYRHLLQAVVTKLHSILSAGAMQSIAIVKKVLTNQVFGDLLALFVLFEGLLGDCNTGNVFKRSTMAKQVLTLSSSELDLCIKQDMKELQHQFEKIFQDISTLPRELETELTLPAACFPRILHLHYTDELRASGEVVLSLLQEGVVDTKQTLLQICALVNSPPPSSSSGSVGNTASHYRTVFEDVITYSHIALGRLWDNSSNEVSNDLLLYYTLQTLYHSCNRINLTSIIPDVIIISKLQSSSIMIVIAIATRLLDRYDEASHVCGLQLLLLLCQHTSNTILVSFAEWLLPKLLKCYEVYSDPLPALLCSRLITIFLTSSDTSLVLIKYGHQFLETLLSDISKEHDAYKAWNTILCLQNLLLTMPSAMWACHWNLFISSLLHTCNLWYLTLQRLLLKIMCFMFLRMSEEMTDSYLSIMTELFRMWLFYKRNKIPDLSSASVDQQIVFLEDIQALAILLSEHNRLRLEEWYDSFVNPMSMSAVIQLFQTQNKSASTSSSSSSDLSLEVVIEHVDIFYMEITTAFMK